MNKIKMSRMRAIKIGNVKMFNIKMLFVFTFLALLVSGVEAQADKRICPDSAQFTGLKCDEFPRFLDTTEIQIRVYTNGVQSNLDRTFVVVHNNEQKGLNAVKEELAKNGINGRLVEVVSNFTSDENLNLDDIRDKNQKRYLYFENDKYCIDPNRIYSNVGIEDKLSLCKKIPNNKIEIIAKFGSELLSLVLCKLSF